MNYPIYGTVSGLKAFLGQTKDDEDDRLAARLAAASRTFDRVTRRKRGAWARMDAVRFFDVTEGGMRVFGGELSARTLYTPKVLRVDSFLSITELRTDDDRDGVFETVWAASDFMVLPYDGPPFRSITVPEWSTYSAFPVGLQIVRIDAAWGECPEPDDEVIDIVYLIASRLRARAKSPEGILGDGERGWVRMGQLDPDVQARIEQGGYLDIGVFA